MKYIGRVYFIEPNFISEDGPVINRRLMICVDEDGTGLVLIPASSNNRNMICPESAGFKLPTYLKMNQRNILKWEDLPRRGILQIFNVPYNVVKEIIKSRIKSKSVLIEFK